jgi:hypothetical protein
VDDPISDKLRLTKGLETIQKVLDYATDSSMARANRHVWVCNAIADLLAGRDVEEPPRATKLYAEGHHHHNDEQCPLCGHCDFCFECCPCAAAVAARKQR